ncbi:hypothetical protein CALCODRAFT_515009 [Calocera cornea HHB12733]|uniref:Aminoglycoside phosphotransferase domain-containing protein n=1 Tax=Calocera cornea HHB12733 TaxID=1353952 RepID=A0A165IQ71_9BASI|nr:hypothetical protein CALCODRAFT_515009 [Calocera cornea HHB12733]
MGFMKAKPTKVEVLNLWYDVPLIAKFWLAVPTRIRVATYRFIWQTLDKIYPKGSISTRVRRVLPGVYLKYGTIKATEPQAMVLVRRHTQLRTSVALDFIQMELPSPYKDDEPYIYSYLLMTAVSGQTVLEVEDTLMPDQITTIGRDLQDYLIAMRNIPNPYDYDICDAAGGTLDVPLHGSYGDVPILKSVGGFHAWVAQGIQLNKHWPTMQPILEPIFSKFNEEDTVFMHGDLSPRNIMVHRGRLSGLIDWETAGWMPSYWEYVSSDFDGPVGEAIIKVAIPERYDAERRGLRMSFGVLHGFDPTRSASAIGD